MRGVGDLEAHIKPAAKVYGPGKEQQHNRNHKGQLDEACAVIGFAEDTEAR
jgi:hypothetical protein